MPQQHIFQSVVSLSACGSSLESRVTSRCPACLLMWSAVCSLQSCPVSQDQPSKIEVSPEIAFLLFSDSFLRLETRSSPPSSPSPPAHTPRTSTTHTTYVHHSPIHKLWREPHDTTPCYLLPGAEETRAKKAVTAAQQQQLVELCPLQKSLSENCYTCRCRRQQRARHFFTRRQTSQATEF